MDTKLNWKPTLMPISCAAVVGCMLVIYVYLAQGALSAWGISWIVFLVSPLTLIGSALLLRRKCSIGLVLAAVGSASAILWVFETESGAYRNSWIAMNASWNDPGIPGYIGYSLFRIISIAVSLATLFWAGTRLLPSNWQVRGRPANQRIWPAIVASLISVATWFILFVSPYRQPVIVDAAIPELGILHVQKDGLTFHETRVTVYHHSRVFLVRNDRKLFRYSFTEKAYEGFLDDRLRTELKAVMGLPELKRTQDKSPRALMARRAEGWYTEMGTYAITAFTTENGASPPKELIEFFHMLESSPSESSAPQYLVRDVCLAFVTTQRLALVTARAENQRCGYGLDGKERCY